VCWNFKQKDSNSIEKSYMRKISLIFLLYIPDIEPDFGLDLHSITKMVQECGMCKNAGNSVPQQLDPKSRTKTVKTYRHNNLIWNQHAFLHVLLGLVP
jgi:hypothetical protein